MIFDRLLRIHARALACLGACCAVVLLGACAEPMPPLPPTSVVAASGPGYIRLSWNHSGAGVTGFGIRRESAAGTVEMAASEVLIGANVRSFIDRDVTVGATYTYSVTAFGLHPVSFPEPATGPVTLEPGVLLVPGTYVNPLFAQPRTALALYFFLPPHLVSEAGANVTVTGPPGWNGDAAIEFAVPMWSLNRGFEWIGPMQAPLTGSYTLAVTALATTFTSSVTLNQLTFLPTPDDIVVTAASFTELSVPLSEPLIPIGSATWSPVPGARSYQGAVYDAPYRSDAAAFGPHFTTSGTSSTIVSRLLPTGQFFVGVTAFAADMTRLPPETVSSFNVAFGASAYFWW